MLISVLVGYFTIFQKEIPHGRFIQQFKVAEYH